MMITKVSPTTRQRQIKKTIHDLENQLEDINYAEQQALKYWHWTPSQYDNEDYFEVNTVLAAKPAEERVQDPKSLIPAGLADGRVRGGVDLQALINKEKERAAKSDKKEE